MSSDQSISKKSIIVEPMYFGPVELFVKLLEVEDIQFEVEDRFVKQTYRNRTSILTANKPLDLVIPVHFKNDTLLKDVKIDYSQSWLKDHERAYHSAYAKSPFYEYYHEQLLEYLRIRPTYLIDVTISSVTNCLKILELEIPVSRTKDFKTADFEGISDLRNVISPKKSFENRGTMTPHSYIQNFGSNFVPNLSILDLLFCTGPEARSILIKSKKIG